MNQNNESKAMRLEMVNIDQCRFAVEVLRNNARVNLTMMAKPFGKRVRDWTRTDEAKAYLEVVAEGQKCASADLLEVRKGGTPETQGTWCSDYRIAMRLAQWLSPKLSVMVDDMLVKLMVGDAVLAEPVNGVEPIICNGKAYYNYVDLVASYGVGRRSNSSRRKNALPAHFKLIYGRNFVTKDYAQALAFYYGWKQQSRQLTLNFQ